MKNYVSIKKFRLAGEKETSASKEVTSSISCQKPVPRCRPDAYSNTHNSIR